MKHLKIKILDIVLIALLIAASFIPNAVFAYQAMSSPADEGGSYLVLKVDSKEIERIALKDGDVYERTIETSPGDTNTIRVENGVVTMIDADCPDQICITAFPPISLDGEQIICLPHRLVVEIDGGEKPQGDLNAY